MLINLNAKLDDLSRSQVRNLYFEFIILTLFKNNNPSLIEVELLAFIKYISTLFN